MYNISLAALTILSLILRSVFPRVLNLAWTAPDFLILLVVFNAMFRGPLIGGATGYVISLVVNLLKGVTQHFRISIGDTVIDDNISLACLCNGRFYGGGFNPVPDAMPDDGVLDCLIVKAVSRVKFVQVVGRYAKGRFRELDDIIIYKQAGGMDIESDREFVVNIDGEAIYAKKISFKLIPKGVNFIFPQEINFFSSNTY